MKSNTKTILLLGFYVVLLLLIAFSFPKKINWTPTYSKEHKLPYGSYVLYERLSDIFGKTNIATLTKPFYNFETVGEKAINYVFVADEFKPDNLDINALLNFAEEGNNVFIAANSFPDKLEDTLGISIEPEYDYLTQRIFNGSDTMNAVSFSFTDTTATEDFSFRNETVLYALKTKPDSIAKHKSDLAQPMQILGTHNNTKAVFAEIEYGSGKIFIHTYPLAFTNYNMLYANNAEYVARCLSYLPQTNTMWDEYYKPLNSSKAGTPLRYILSLPAYAWAYYIAIASLIVYVLFASKRLQRSIAVIEPHKNQSLEFTRTIGTLYFNKRNHKDLAVKKMTYFLEKVRHYFYVNTSETGNAFIQKLSQKSVVDAETIRRIFVLFEAIEQRSEITDAQLQTFNTAIEKFYNQSGLNNKL
jgi:hypothetical protein